jgi:hypothetical protein
MEQEELTWIQRARANWLKHGGRNTMFFQQFASSRKKRNMITSLVNEQGVRQVDSDTMHSMVHYYFTHLFQSEMLEFDVSVTSGNLHLHDKQLSSLEKSNSS